MQNQEDSLERLVRDGILYLEQKKYLDQIQITGKTVLVPTEVALHPQTWMSPVRAALFSVVEPLLIRIDGRKSLTEALADANLTRRAYIAGVYHLIAGGFALVREPDLDSDESGERVNLPPWVVARLKQDNPDLSQAIVDLVIWVDRVKCWMFQVDADFTRILEEVEAEEAVEAPDEDFFAELERGNIDVEEPLCGEPMIEFEFESTAPAFDAVSKVTALVQTADGRNAVAVETLAHAASAETTTPPGGFTDKTASPSRTGSAAQNQTMTKGKKSPPQIEF
jgi:hypothetical protein